MYRYTDEIKLNKVLHHIGCFHLVTSGTTKLTITKENILKLL